MCEFKQWRYHFCGGNCQPRNATRDNRDNADANFNAGAADG